MHCSAAIWQRSPASPPFEACFQRSCVLANANSGETPLLLAQETPARFALLEKNKDGKISRSARSSCVFMQLNRRDLRRLNLRELRVLRGRRSHSRTFDASDRENMKMHEPRRTRSSRRKTVTLDTDSERSCGTSWFDRFLPLVQPTLPLLIFWGPSEPNLGSPRPCSGSH